ncbi:hypothetical protein [Oceaniglobus indicus]|uniref:hypothetical protein n=1 Tax=Oceaniglobus indicus TaxID=2047749 RepID=UPI000C178BFE|nr:hypothetical protein [Oceaniglobus indicus]
MLVALGVGVACTPMARDDLTRAAARNAIRPVVQQRLPGVPVEPAIDCVIDNAQSAELLSLASDAVTGPTANTVQIVTNIASREGALRCLATEGLPALLR